MNYATFLALLPFNFFHAHACMCTHAYCTLKSLACFPPLEACMVWNGTFRNHTVRGIRGTSIVKSTHCPFKGSRFESQHPYGRLQASLTLVLDHPSSPGFFGHHACTWRTSPLASKTIRQYFTLYELFHNWKISEPNISSISQWVINTLNKCANCS